MRSAGVLSVRRRCRDFGQHEMFGDYLKQFQPKQVREEIIKLFRVLDTKPEDRDPYMEDDLAAFPYVNGGLFADENIEIPRFTEEIVDLLVNKASAGFDWSEISPTIFGAVFESTLNPETRRSGGMHYTSLENIHKVIDPLFLDELKAELEEIKALKVAKTRAQRLQEYRKKLSQLTFLDPAAGSGNFLTETYISLRRLENDALYEEHRGQMMLGGEGEYNPIQVSIGQFLRHRDQRFCSDGCKNRPVDRRKPDDAGNRKADADQSEFPAAEILCKYRGGQCSAD